MDELHFDYPLNLQVAGHRLSPPAKTLLSWLRDASGRTGEPVSLDWFEISARLRLSAGTAADVYNELRGADLIRLESSDGSTLVLSPTIH